MGYLYDSLKKAIGGANARSGMTIKGWSPNEIRCIWIMRNFIMITDYVNTPKVYPLNMQEVGQDIQHVNGNLNNLLENRQLSCLEEIYVDVYYQQMTGIIDLRAYVQKVYNQQSRLRYYGYIPPVENKDVMGLYNFANNVLLNSIFDATFAESMNMNVVSTGNKFWYQRYNLRPQYYDMDLPKGKLHTYFVKCERVVEEKVANAYKQAEIQSLNQNVSTMLRVDFNSARRLSDLLRLINYSKNCDEYMRVVADRVRGQIMCRHSIEGVTKEFIIDFLKTNKIPVGDAEKYVLGWYEKSGVFDTSGKSLNLNSIEPKDGFLRLGMRMDIALADVVNTCCSTSERKLVMVNALHSVGRIPEGKFLMSLSNKGLNLFDKCEFNRDDLFATFYALCGYVESDWSEFVSKRERGNQD